MLKLGATAFVCLVVVATVDTQRRIVERAAKADARKERAPSLGRDDPSPGWRFDVLQGLSTTLGMASASLVTAGRARRSSVE